MISIYDVKFEPKIQLSCTWLHCLLRRFRVVDLAQNVLVLVRRNFSSATEQQHDYEHWIQPNVHSYRTVWRKWRTLGADVVVVVVVVGGGGVAAAAKSSPVLLRSSRAMSGVARTP